MRALKIAVAVLFVSLATAPAAAGKPGIWQVEPSGEGGGGTYVYASSHGRFLAGPRGSAIWIIYGPRKPRADGTCSFDSCTINVTLNGRPGYEQEWIKFDFSDGTSVTARPNVKAGQYNVINDYSRVQIPEVAKIMNALRAANWVDVTFADGNMRRFSLAGSSAALKRGAAVSDGF